MALSHYRQRLIEALDRVYESSGRVEAATEAGRAFSVGTGVQTVPVGEKLKLTFANPSDSGRRLFVAKRVFGCDRSGNDIPLAFEQKISPDALTGATTQNPANLLTGGMASQAVFEWLVDGSSLTSSVNTNIGGFIPLNGLDKLIETVRVVSPGESFGYQITGAGGEQLASASKVFASVVWYEEEIE